MATKVALLSGKDGSKSEDATLVIQQSGVKCIGDIRDRATVNIGEEKMSQFQDETRMGGDVVKSLVVESRGAGSGKTLQISSHDPLRLVVLLVLALVAGMALSDHWKLQRLEQRVMMCERLAPAVVGGSAAVAVDGDADELMRVLEAADAAALSGPADDDKLSEKTKKEETKEDELPVSNEESYDVTSDEDDDVIMRGEGARQLGTNIVRKRRSADGNMQSDEAHGNRGSRGRATTRIPPGRTPKSPRRSSDPMSAAFHLQLHVNPDGSNLVTLERTPYKIWRPANWTNGDSLKYYHYDHDHGKLHVRQSGIYFIYAQILYQNQATRNSYSVMIDEREFIQCFTSVDAVSDVAGTKRYKTCHVGAATRLDRDDKVWVKEQYGQAIDTDAESSYFGVVKLADLS